MCDNNHCLKGDFPIGSFPSVFTERVFQLIEQIRYLAPYKELYFNIMKDEHLIKNSAGASVNAYKNKDIVELDPERVNEHAVAHELMHVILHCSGWPQMYCLIENDEFAKGIANKIDNALDHYIFNPKLEQIGIDVTSYQKGFINAYRKWPVNEPISDKKILWDALTIFESLLFGKSYRGYIINILKNTHPTSLNLARQILKRTPSLQSSSKQGLRQSMVLILDFINRWVAEKSGRQQYLRTRIGISPLFTANDLKQPAISSLYYRTAYFKEKNLWSLTFGLKKDKTNFLTFHNNIGNSDFQPVINNYESLSVQEFLDNSVQELLDSETSLYGVID